MSKSKLEVCLIARTFQVLWRFFAEKEGIACQRRLPGGNLSGRQQMRWWSVAAGELHLVPDGLQATEIFVPVWERLHSQGFQRSLRAIILSQIPKPVLDAILACKDSDEVAVVIYEFAEREKITWLAQCRHRPAA